MLASKLKMTKAIYPVRQSRKAMQICQADAQRQVERHSSAPEQPITRRCEMAVATPRQDISHKVPEGRAT